VNEPGKQAGDGAGQGSAQDAPGRASVSPGVTDPPAALRDLLLPDLARLDDAAVVRRIARGLDAFRQGRGTTRAGATPPPAPDTGMPEPPGAAPGAAERAPPPSVIPISAADLAELRLRLAELATLLAQLDRVPPGTEAAAGSQLTVAARPTGGLPATMPGSRRGAAKPAPALGLGVLVAMLLVAAALLALRPSWIGLSPAQVAAVAARLLGPLR
jgi:hypothetical protein